jgi:hypothetical protein
MAMFVEMTTWQEKVQNLPHNHADKAISTQEEEKKKIPLKQKFLNLKKVMGNKESEMHVTKDSSNVHLLLMR